jgi:hypothetical protein
MSLDGLSEATEALPCFYGVGRWIDSLGGGL